MAFPRSRTRVTKLFENRHKCGLHVAIVIVGRPVWGQKVADCRAPGGLALLIPRNRTRVTKLFENRAKCGLHVAIVIVRRPFWVPKVAAPIRLAPPLQNLVPRWCLGLIISFNGLPLNLAPFGRLVGDPRSGGPKPAKTAVILKSGPKRVVRR